MELHQNIKPAAIIWVLALACIAPWLLPTTGSAQESTSPAQAGANATEPVLSGSENGSQVASKCPVAADQKNCQQFCARKPSVRQSDEVPTNQEQLENCRLAGEPDLTIDEEPEYSIDIVPTPPPAPQPMSEAPLWFVILVAIWIAFLPASLVNVIFFYLLAAVYPNITAAPPPVPRIAQFFVSWVTPHFGWMIVFAIIFTLQLGSNPIVNFAHSCLLKGECTQPCEEKIIAELLGDPSEAHLSYPLRNASVNPRIFRADVPTGEDIKLKPESSIRYSELLNIGDDHFLFLRDTKRYPLNTKYVRGLYDELQLGALKLQPSQYLGVVEYAGGEFFNGRTVPILLPGVEDGDTKPLPFDIESACIYDVGPARHLIHAIESGQNRASYVAGYYPRVVPLDMPSYRADEATWDYTMPDKIPAEVTRLLGSYPNRGLYNIEGHTCFTQGRLQLRIFAERGSHKTDQFGNSDDTTPMSKIVIDGFDDGPVLRKIINPQDIKPSCARIDGDAEWREVSALTINKADGSLWGASSYESKSEVCSKIYTLKRDPVLTTESPDFEADVHYVCKQNKIEGLAFADDGFTLIVATDDEEKGGVIGAADDICP